MLYNIFLKLIKVGVMHKFIHLPKILAKRENIANFAN